MKWTTIVGDGALRLTAAAVGLLIAAALAGLVVVSTRSDSGARSAPDGSTSVQAQPPPSPAQSPVATISATPPGSPTAQPSTAPRSPATRPSTAPPNRPSTAPAPGDVLAIPALHVDAPIDRCSVEHRNLEPPADVGRSCAWAGGAGVSATAGTTTIVGQPDWIGQPPAAFASIGQLRPGDLVRISGSRWRVARVFDRRKSTGVEPAAFVGRTGPRRLYLISGGGAYDAVRHRYLDNVYVLATPAH